VKHGLGSPAAMNTIAVFVLAAAVMFETVVPPEALGGDVKVG
jgi:hypothetical protein